MADIRIKDLGTTASVTASDDFMAVDGTTNGTRKLSAAAPAFLTSVTTPSLTSPASTDLTLGTGTSGAAITVLSASNNVGIGTTSPNRLLQVAGSVYINTNLDVIGTIFGVTNKMLDQSSTYTRLYDAAGTLVMSLGSGNVGIGTTDLTGLTGAGGLKIASTTAGSSNAGALVLQGGISAGNTGSAASYFGGAVSITGNIGFYGQAATAKPTGVAVTAAAIHAALVTLNLIAA